MTFEAGRAVEFTVEITAHHMGYFEFEFCDDAGQLSEECFAQHRLLRDGCECNCPDDPSNSCADCSDCRRWWKPLIELEANLGLASGYDGTVLDGASNTAAYEFKMRYVIPSGIQTCQGVLRWHYMTTNSCTGSPTAAPEEFWNCADVEVTDPAGNCGDEVPFDNDYLQGIEFMDLYPQIVDEDLVGVNFECPESAIGTSTDYANICGEKFENGTYERCVAVLSPYNVTEICQELDSLPPGTPLCEEPCGFFWFSCEFRDTPFERVNLMAVPFGAACFDGEFTDDCDVCPSLAQCQGTTSLSAANASASPPPAAATSPAAAMAATAEGGFLAASRRRN